jgi:hypothetical protein
VMLAACAAPLLLASPVSLAAQDEVQDDAAIAEAVSAADSDLAAMQNMFNGLFTAEPLTSEQETRLPAAERLIAKIIPEGTMGEMIDSVMGGVLGSMMAATPEGARNTLAKQIGTDPYSLDLPEDQAGALASLFDPAWEERQRREIAMIPVMMKDMVALMEPGMRKAMSELYAIRFTAAELADIDAFFSTSTGTKYARESFLMASDPRIMASTMEAMPALMGSIGDIEKRMADSVADLPAVRSFGDLSPTERARVAEATGFTVEQIEENLVPQDFDYAVEEGAYGNDEVPQDEAEVASDAPFPE